MSRPTPLPRVRRLGAALVLVPVLGAAVPAAAQAVPFGHRALHRGDHGHDVRVLQSWLGRLGFPASVDGVFGRRTERAVRRYERHEAIRVDGRVSRREARRVRRQVEDGDGHSARKHRRSHGHRRSHRRSGPAFGDRPLRRGDHGHDVRVLQHWLTLVGIETGLDGIFGRQTERNVETFERLSKRRTDGVVSPADADVLRSYVEGEKSVVDAENPDKEYPAPQGSRARIVSQHEAVAPADAPPEVVAAIEAANSIADRPYRYGGGHGRFRDSAYDCSGTVSFVLHAAGLLDRTMTSGELERWGRRGKGNWITVYANAGHTYIVIAGQRFDTSGAGQEGPRWRRQAAKTRGYVVRHPAGL